MREPARGKVLQPVFLTEGYDNSSAMTSRKLAASAAYLVLRACFPDCGRTPYACQSKISSKLKKSMDELNNL